MNCPTANALAAAAPNFKKLRRESTDFGIIYLLICPVNGWHPGSGLLLELFLALQPCPFDQVEQEHCHQVKGNDSQVWIQVPQVRDNYIAKVGNLGNQWEHLRIGQPPQDRSHEKT